MENKQLTYKDAMEEMEAILEKLENEEPDVDKLTENVKRISILLEFCKQKLTNTEEEIQKIINKMDS